MKLIPPLAYINSKSTAEKRVASLLHQIEGDEQALAYHSVHLPEHEYKAMAEADFVVLWKGAVIVLEIKGGNIRREAGLWIFRDRYGVDHTKAEGPWQQAQSAMFALRKRIEKTLPLPRFPYAAAVITPDQNLAEDFEWGAWEYAGHSAMTIERFAKVLDDAAARARSTHGHDSPQSFKPLKSILRSDFDRLFRLSDEVEMIDRQMVALLEGQSALLEGLEDNTKVIIKGGAGTGKTLLAAEVAARISSEGNQNVLFTCRSAAVVQVVAKLLENSSVTCAAFSDLGDGAIYDALVIDEAQDLMNVDGLITLNDVLKGGLESGKWWMFMDHNNQAHIDGDFDPDMLSDLQKAAVQYTLRLNCRNTEPIVGQIQTLLGADLGTPKVGAGPKVGVVHARTANVAADGIDAEIGRLRDGGALLGDIAIITMKPDPGNSVAWNAEISQGGALGRSFTEKSLKLWTPREIKGLESRHVLVVDIDDLDELNSSSMLYVAMTRARISLWLAIGDPAWRQMGEMAKATWAEPLRGN